jgi:hypothetical protein
METSANKVVTGKRRGEVAGVPVAYLAIWAALYALAGVLPAIPMVGGGTLGGQEFLMVVAGVLFGPLAGSLAAGVGGLVASFIAPATANFGLLTFYPHVIGALAAGLLIRNTWKSKGVVIGMLVGFSLIWWLVPPFNSIGGPVFAQGGYWPMYLTVVIPIALTPWAVRQIKTFDVKRVPWGLLIIGWAAYMVNHVAANLGYSYLYPQGPDSWVFAFWSGIVPLQRLALIVVSAIIGTALLIGLQRAGIRFPNAKGSALQNAPVPIGKKADATPASASKSGSDS